MPIFNRFGITNLYFSTENTKSVHFLTLTTALFLWTTLTYLRMEGYAKQVVSEFLHKLQKEAQFLKRGSRFRGQLLHLFWNTFKRG